MLLQRLHAELHVGGSLDGEAAADFGDDGVGLRLCLTGRDAGLHPAERVQEYAVAVGVLKIDAQRRPDVGGGLGVLLGREEQLEPGGEHADDLRAASAAKVDAAAK